MKPNILIAVGAILGFALMTSPAANAGAFVITDLFNTGVDGSGVALGDNVLDPHYTLTAQPNNGTFLAETVFDDTFPIPPLGCEQCRLALDWSR